LHHGTVHAGRRFNAEFGSVIHVGEEHMAEGVVENPNPLKPSVSTVIFARRKSMVRANVVVVVVCKPQVD
jgi:hypothetical protein